MPMGKFVMDYWAAEARLEGEAEEPEPEDDKGLRGRLGRWANRWLCAVGRGGSRLGTWLERRGLPSMDLARRLERSGC